MVLGNTYADTQIKNKEMKNKGSLKISMQYW